MIRKNSLPLAFAYFLCVSSNLEAQSQVGILEIDEVATNAIFSATTDTDFLTEWVAVLPEHDTIPSPRDVLGYTIGTVSYTHLRAHETPEHRVWRLGL